MQHVARRREAARGAQAWHAAWLIRRVGAGARRRAACRRKRGATRGRRHSGAVWVQAQRSSVGSATPNFFFSEGYHRRF
jgi:hypothetical protein